jgi:hypothetical protein
MEIVHVFAYGYTNRCAHELPASIKISVKALSGEVVRVAVDPSWYVIMHWEVIQDDPHCMLHLDQR